MRDLRVIGAAAVAAALDGREDEVIEAVRRAYLDLGVGHAGAAESTFLRFASDRADRIIALPSRLGEPTHTCGVKWIASFPGNLDRGLDRASAVIVLNDPETGYPLCVMEGSVVSARRTAASAALAASAVHPASESRVGIVGCGLINREVLRFLRLRFPGIEEAWIHDTVRARAEAFAAATGLRCRIAPLTEIADACALVSFATSAVEPHFAGAFRPGATVLHLSLRDLAPETLRGVTNIVDLATHAFSARTSLHLAALAAPPGPPVHALADVLHAGSPREGTEAVVFSPFGLGVLDLALASIVYADARDAVGLIPDFFPAPWARPA